MTATEYQVKLTATRHAELVPVERPTEPLGSMDVAGHALATLISPGTELASYVMDPPRWANVGYAAVFEVEQVGSEVTDIQVGQRVFLLGPHRSYHRAPRKSVLVVPEGLDSADACFARMMAITMATLSTTVAHPPAAVLVTGLGMVGYLAATIFQSCGYRVVACDVDKARRDFASAHGLKDVRPAVPLDDPQLCGRIALVVECSGHEQAVIDACRVVRKGGEVSLVGVPWVKRSDAGAFDLLTEVFHHYVVLRSGWEHQLPIDDTAFHANCAMDNLAGALRWLAEGRIDVRSLYDVAKPQQATEVYDKLSNRKTDKLTVAFDWSGDR